MSPFLSNFVLSLEYEGISRGGMIRIFQPARRTFTTYRLRLSHFGVVARITQLQLQQLQHLQLFADLHLQHFWQTSPCTQNLRHRIATLPLLPFVPICPPGADGTSDN
jgi:hypothetical protein